MLNIAQQLAASDGIGSVTCMTGRRRRYDACVGFAPGSRPWLNRQRPTGWTMPSARMNLIPSHLPA